MAGRDFSAELFGATTGRDFSSELFGAERPEQQSAFRQVADIPLGFGKGVVQGVRMIADAFGAGSETSQKIKGAEEYLAGLMSAQAQNDQKEISRIMKDAEDKGVLEQVKAGVQAFTKAPVDLLTQAFGTAVPAIIGSLGAQVLGGGALVATGVGALTGAGMGAGVIKGSIYEETKKALKEAGATEQVAEEKAQQAQAYGGKNLDQILLGTVLGGVAAVGPLEKGAAGMLARRILGKVSGEEVAEQAAKGALRRRAEGAIIEAVPEALQAGQEQVAQNIALQREGFDVPTMRGVAGASTLEGLAGFGLGAISSGRPRAEPRAEAPAPEAPEAPAPEAPLEPEFQPSDEDVELEQLTETQRQELEAQRAAAGPREDVLGEVQKQVQVFPATTLEDVSRIRDEHETSIIEKLLAQDAEMQSSADAARQRLQDLSDIESRDAAIKDVDRRLRESRIFSAAQDLIDRNIPFASTAISDINQNFERINEAPLSTEERARVENIMGMARAFTDFVKLPVLPAKPIDPFAENRQMESLIKERKPSGQVQPDAIRAAPAAPSPVVEEAPVSPGTIEGEPARPPSGVEPSVEEDSQRVVTPVADVAETPPLEPSIEERLQSLRDQQQALLTKSGKVPAPKSPARKQYDALEAEIQSLSVPTVDLVEQPVFDVKPAEETLPSGKTRKRPKSIMGSPMLADIFFSVGGLDTSLLSEFSTLFETRQLDRKGRPVIRYRNPMVPGFGNLFNNRGTMDFTEIATVLEDRGYLEPGSVERDSTEAGERAKELIRKALNREEVLPVDEQAAKLAAEREESDRQADLERREENRAIAYGELQLDEEYMGPEDLQEALDLENELATEMEIYNLEPEDFQFLSDQEFEEGLTDAERATAEERRARKAEQDTARKTAEAVPAGEATAFDLERPTAERLKEQEERIKEAEKREAAAKRAAQESERKAREERDLRVRAEQTVKDFELGKSAEEQMSGMEDMFKEEKLRTATKEQMDSADGHADSVGGTVVYQDGDISLVRGHAILSGQPVYVVANGNYRSKVDIESYTGNLITPEQKAELIKIKNDIEKADEKAFKKSPFIRFDDGLAVSGNVPIEIAGIVRGWKDLLNLKPNLYVTTIEDAKANKDNFNGPHRAISSSGLNANEAGSVRKLPNGDYYIAFKKGTSKSKMLEVLGHELGHMHEREVFNNADAQTQKELRDEHSKWLKSTKGLTAKQLIDSLRAKTSAKTTRIQKGLMADEMTPYWKSFSEWYADQVSRWSVTNEKPLSVVEKFFSRLGKALRNFYNKITNQGYLPNETFVQYLDKVNKQPGLIGTPTKNEPVQGELFMLKEAKAATEKFQARREEIIKKAVVEGSEAMQKRRLDKGAFEGVSEDLFEKLKPVFAPKSVTILERVYDMRDNFWQRVAQGMADQFRTIKDYSYDAYIKARLSKSIDGSLEGLMFYGQVFNDGGALNIKKNTRGMFEILKPIGKELDRYLIWIALNRDAMQPDSKRSISQDLVSRRDELSAGTLNGKPREEVYRQVQKEMNQLNRSVLKVAVDTGLLNTTAGAIKDIENNDRLSDEEKSEKIAELRKNPIGYERFINDLNYIPFYKIMEDGDLDSVSKAASASGLTSQQFSKALKGGERPFGDLMENTLKNWSHILSASMKNQAGVAAIEAAVKAGLAVPNLRPGLEFVDGKVYSTKTNKPVGDGELRAEQTEGGKGTVNVVQDGKKVYYVVSDPLLMDSITSIGYLGNQSKFLDVARNFKNLLQYGVTLSPQFKVNNLIRDSIAAMGVSELKLNPIANVMQGVSLSDRNNETYIEAMAGGGIFNFGTAYEGDQSRLIKRLLKMGVDRDHVLDAEDRITTGIKYAWNKYNEWGNRSENANRLALYKQLRDKGMSHLEATFKARDLMDFSMQGTWPAFRLLTQVIPFLNARVQGLYKLGRDGINPTLRVINNTVTGKEIDATDKQKAQQFSIVSMGVVMASALLYLAFKDDEEYKRRDDWDKDNFWWFRIPGMDFALRVPKPFEIGALGTLVERTLEQILDSGAEGKEFGEALFRMLTNTFAINPTPQIIKPLVDIYANKDSFSGAPIESAGLERLSRQERMVETTTPLAIALGKISSLFPEKFEMSPVQMDYLIKGYFGWLGGTIAATSTYAVMPFREGEYPDARWMDRMSLGLAREIPGRGAKYVTAFYDANKEISQAYADMRHYSQIGDSEKVQKILEEKGNKIRLQKLYDGTAKHMANIRKQIRLVQTDKQMDGSAKKEAIDRMQDMISMLAKQAEDVRKSMKGERP